MDLQDLKEKLVAVLGYGQEGKAVAAYLLKHGIKPVLFDQKPWEQWDEIEKLEIEKLGVNFIFGPDCFEELKGFDAAFRSPGIKIPDVAQGLALPGRQAEGLRYSGENPIITSQAKFFFDHCPASIIGITGTKGKGTTASLIYEILKTQYAAPEALSASERLSGVQPKANSGSRLPPPDALGLGRDKTAGPQIYLTGNIGKIQPLEILDELKPDDWVVYELSSFQLQDLDRSPHIGVVLMTTSEHLDYHSDEKEYVEAKSAITKFQTADDFAVINDDYENSVKIGGQGKGKKLYFSLKKTGIGCFVSDGNLVAPNFQFSISNLQLKGEHNRENIMAAVLAAQASGCDNEAITSAVKKFTGLEHRLEFVAEKNGVKFYNDSFSTTPETAIAAIKSFTEPLIVILGGSSKNSDFTELGKTISETKNIKALILIGEEATRIKLAIPSSTLTPARPPLFLEGARDIKEIFEQIKSVAISGDIVLLSPACASFGMFKNYKDRGEQFKKFASEF